MERQVELSDPPGRQTLAGSGHNSVCGIRTDSSGVRHSMDPECGAAVVLFAENEMAG